MKDSLKNSRQTCILSFFHWRTYSTFSMVLIWLCIVLLLDQTVSCTFFRRARVLRSTEKILQHITNSWRFCRSSDYQQPELSSQCLAVALFAVKWHVFCCCCNMHPQNLNSKTFVLRSWPLTNKGLEKTSRVLRVEDRQRASASLAVSNVLLWEKAKEMLRKKRACVVKAAAVQSCFHEPARCAMTRISQFVYSPSAALVSARFVPMLLLRIAAVKL